MSSDEKKRGFISPIKDFFYAAIRKIDSWYCGLPLEKIGGRLGIKFDLRSGKFKRILHFAEKMEIVAILV